MTLKDHIEAYPKYLKSLKPCPWCGGMVTADLRYNFIYCDNADCKIKPQTHGFTTAEIARDAWNAREGGEQE